MSSMNLKFFMPVFTGSFICQRCVGHHIAESTPDSHRRMMNVMLFYVVQELLLAALDWSARSFRV